MVKNDVATLISGCDTILESSNMLKITSSQLPIWLNFAYIFDLLPMQGYKVPLLVILLIKIAKYLERIEKNNRIKVSTTGCKDHSNIDIPTTFAPSF